MLTQSKETRDAWRASQRTLDIKVTIDGKTYGATDINSLKYDSGAYNGDTFAIGSTYSNTVQIEFSHLIEGLKLGMEVHPSIGIKTSSGYVYEPLGVFIISSEIKMDRNNNLTTVSASDRFCGLEGAYVSKLTYPAKVLDVIAEICAQSGVKANTNDLARLPHQEDLPAPITGQSYRKALGWIAQLYVGYALFDRQGLFTIRTISEPNYELDPSQYEQAGLTKNEAAYKINGIQCQVTLTTKTRDGESTEETKTYQAGDATGSQIKLENNIMTPQRLNDIWEQLKDLTFYPFSLNWFGNPAVEAGDWLWLEDKQGNSFVVPNSSYTLDFNGGLSATSKADQTTSSDQMVPWQGSVAQVIKELQARRSPDGTVVFPPSVTAPPTNAKFNDVWFKKNGNSTELWIFEKQDDGSGKWIRKDLSDDEIKKKVADAQQGLNQAKADIINNKQKADADIENLNKSIEDNKKATDQDIQSLNESIEANKKVADESLQKLNNSVTNLQGQYDNNVVPNLNKVIADASDALQKYISAQNSIADLTKQAQEQGKDIADVTNTVKGLNINYANLVGDVNSTKVYVKGLQTTVGTANGDIAQLKLDAQNLQAMLAGKVDNTAYTNFVNLTNQALNARLTASDLNGYAKTVDVQATANGLRVDLNSVTDRMNNLKIGGRNLLHNTSDQYRTLTNDGAWLQKTTASTDMTSVANYHSGDRFTYAATVTNTSNQPVMLEFHNCGQDKQWLTRIQSSPVPVGAKDYRVAVSLPITEKTYYLQTWLIFQGGKGVPGEQIQVKDERLVFGTISNTWSPNPEDVAQNITELSSRITANSQQFSSYYTKTETDTRTNSAKNDAVNTIRNDGNWQGLSNILTNSGFLQTADGFLQKVQQTLATGGNSINLAEKTNQGTTNWSVNPGNGTTTISEVNINGIRGVRFTQTKKSTTWWVITYKLNLDYFEPNQDYIISFDIRTSSDSFNQNGVLNIERGDSSHAYLANISFKTNFKKNQLTHVSCTGHSYSSLDKNGETFYLNCAALGQCDWVDIINLKIARGTIDKGYSPAPSDNVTQIAFSELSQSLEGLRSTVDGNYGALQSQLSQTATTIRGELTNNVTGLQNQITANASGITALIQGNPVSLIRKGSFEDGSKGMWDNSATIVDVNNNNVPFTKALCISKRDSYEEKRINVTPGDHYLVKAWIKSDEAQNNRVSVGLFLIKKDGKFDWINGAITVNHDWELVTGEITIPNDVVAAEGWIQIDAAQNFGHAYLADISITKISDKTMQVAATLDGLQSTVSNNYGNLQSQISQSSSTLRTELTDKIKGIDNKTTSTANSLNSVIGRVGSLENLTNFQVINNAINANDYIKTGNYFIQSTSNTNVPATNWCYLKVEKVNDGRIVQTWQADNDPTLRFVRTKIGDSWTSWQRAASYSEYSELNRTVQGLQSTVSSNYGQLQSLNTQTATAIRNEVTDKVNNLQGQITTQANNLNLKIGTASDLSNICRNPTFDNHDGWTDSVHVESNWSEIPTKNAGVLFERDGYYGDFFTVSKGEKYYFSVFGHNGSQYAFCLGLQYLLNNGEYSWQGASWIQSGETKTAEGRLVVPNNAVSARVWVSLQGTSNLGWVRFTNVIVKKNDTLAQINMSAGTTLIQNDKIYMDASSTVFSGNAFIPSAAITSLNADKITTGTLNAANVNIINLNANNITTGTINGQNLKIDLDTGNVEFQHGRIHNFSNTVDINLDQNYISTANYNTRALLKDGELQLTQPNLYDTNGNWYFRLYNGGGAGDAWAGASLIGRDSVIVANEGNAQGATGFTSSPMGTATFSGLFTGKGTNNWMPTILGGAERGVFIKGGNQMSIKQNVMDPNDGGVFVTGSPFISVGVDGPNNNWWGNRIVIDGEYLHVPTAWRHTTGGAPNLVVADDGAIVRSTSASKYKTEIHRDYSTKYGDRLLELPTATWIDKGQKERYQKGERHIKPNKYFGMIAEDLADAGLDLLVSRNSQTHEIEGIQYERIGPALIPVIRKLKKKVQQLEEKLNEQ